MVELMNSLARMPDESASGGVSGFCCCVCVTAFER